MRARDLVGKIARRTAPCQTKYGEDKSYMGDDGTLIVGYSSASRTITHKLVHCVESHGINHSMDACWDDDNWEPVDAIVAPKKKRGGPRKINPITEKEDAMDKALVVQAEWSELRGEGSLKIISQKFRNGEFYKGGNKFTGSNGTSLQSMVNPQFVEKYASILYVRGSSKYDDDKIVSTKSKDMFDKILVTIDEYNEEMAKPKAKALTKAQKDGMIEHSKDVAFRAASIFKRFNDRISASKDMDDAMKAKVDLMIGILGCIPMGVDTCPFCVVNDKDCGLCDYRVKHGHCMKGDSTYMATSNMISDLSSYIRSNYWKGL